MKKRAWQFAGFVMVIMFAMFAGACANLDDFSAVQKDLAQVKTTVQQNSAALGQKADKAEVAIVAKQQGETAKLLGDTAKVVADIKKEAATKAEVAKLGSEVGQRVGNVEGDLVKTDQTVARVASSVDGRLNSLEKRVVGMKQVTARVGALEDSQGIDHKVRLFRLAGFATASAELSSAMKKELDKVVFMEKKGGWQVQSVVGFADPRPFKDDKDDKKNVELAQARAKTAAEYLIKAIGGDPEIKYEGRGATTKFGGLDMNRSVLIYLERSQTPAPAPPAQSQAAPPAALAPTPPAATPPAPPQKP